MRDRSILTQGSVRRMISGIRARSSTWPGDPQEYRSSRRPVPSGEMTANEPCAGSPPNSRRFARAPSPRPWGEMISGIS